MLPWPTADAARRLPSASSVSKAFPRADQLDRLQHGIAAAKSEPRLVEQAALGALHREGDSAPGADGVDAELVAPPRRPEDGVAVRDAAEGAEGEQALVLDADAAVAQCVDVFASNRAGHAARASSPVPRTELLRREFGRVLEGAALEIPGRQRAEAVECEKVRRGSKLAVLRGGRSEGSLRQVTAQLGQLGRPGPIAALRSTDGNGFEVLAAEHRSAAAAAGVAAVVRNRRVSNTALAGRSNRRDAEIAAEPSAQLFLGCTDTPRRGDRRRPPASISPSSTTRTEQASARPTMTIASHPQRLPAMANPLLASESLNRSVNGLRLTTANLAEVVSGLPTRGLKAKTSGASGDKRIHGCRALVQQQRCTETAAAQVLPQHLVGERNALCAGNR